MSKVLRIVAAVASVVALIPSPIQPIAAAVAVTASIGAELTAKRPSNDRQGLTDQFKIDPNGPLAYIIGRTSTGGTIAYRKVYGTDNHYKTYFAILSAGGPIDAIETFSADSVPVLLSGTSAVGYYNKWLWQDQQLGQTPEPRALGSGVVSPPFGTAGPVPGWGAAYKLSGYAAASLTLLFDTKARRYASGEPVPSWIVRGVKVYDPRLDSTYPGGSGSCRWADPRNAAAHAAARLTWIYSETPALHSLKWKLGIWQRDESNPSAAYRKILGIGAPIDLIDVAAHVASANVQELNGWKAGGELNSDMGRWDACKLIEQAGGAEPISNGARLSTLQKAPRVSLATITTADLANGRLSIPSNRMRRERLNGFRAQFKSEAHGWQMVPIDIVQVRDYVIADGGERTGSGDYQLVQDPDQAASLAAYEVFDSRELLPITLPLKPKWMGYRIGDCVTLAMPELGLANQPVIIRGRSQDPASSIVTLTFATETAGKHAAALGQTGVVPPVPALSTGTGDVPAPAASEWTLEGATFTDNGVSIPAMVVTGAVGNTNADAVVFSYRPAGVGAEWAGASFDAPETIRKEITGLTPGTQYEVSVQYRARGVISDRLVLGPVFAGAFGAARGAYLLRTYNVDYPVSSTDTAISLVAFTGVIDDGRAIAFPADTLAGLGSATQYGVFRDLSAAIYVAAAAPAAAQFASSQYVFIGWSTTANAGGTSYPSTPTPPGGWGGGGRNPYEQEP
ncbi:hypothetical protein [Sphingomonas faeni]|uniref:hypothetical protein n=1 Tax=Sphingomonas faeni TaxID=185950 RepID=UPI00335E6CA2